MTSLGARLLRNVLWLGAGEALIKGGLFVVGIVVARLMGPSSMGIFTVSYGAALVLMQVLAGGQAELLIREVARLPEESRGLLAGAYGWQRRVAVIAVPLAVAGALLTGAGLLRWTLLAFIPYAWLRSRLVTAAAVFKGLDRMEVEVGARTVELAVLLTGTMIMARLGAPVWATGLAFGAGAAAAIATIRRPLGALPPPGRRFLHGPLGREGAWFVGISLAGLLLGRADTFLLAALGVAAASVGHYGAALSLIWGLIAVPQLLAVAIYPTVSRAASSAGLTPRRVLLIGGAAATGGLAVGAAIALLAPHLVPVIFGDRYGAAVPLLARMAWSLPGAFLAMLAGIPLAALRRQRWGMVLQVGLLAGVVGANLAVIPRFGPLGSATVMAVAQSLGGLGSIALALQASRRRLAEGVEPGVAETAR